MDQRATRALILLAAMAVPSAAFAQEPAPAGANAAPASSPRWSGDASLFAYFIPDDSDYLQPTASADRGWLHLEARYNYEAQKTASFWFGANFEMGDTVTLAITPMFGVVTGDTDGVAPGLHLTFNVWKLEFYSEGEWVFDTGESSDSFVYNWSEFTLRPVEWFRFGLVTQRTRAYQSERDIQRGILAGVMWRKTLLTGHVFEPFSDTPTVVVAFGIEF
jgi:hypothetical protein